MKDLIAPGDEHFLMDDTYEVVATIERIER